MSENEIFQRILTIRGVFNLTDLFYLMNVNYEINNRSLIMNVLDELCENGLVKYIETSDNRWGFRVVR
jgi:hypothetical protein